MHCFLVWVFLIYLRSNKLSNIRALNSDQAQQNDTSLAADDSRTSRAQGPYATPAAQTAVETIPDPIGDRGMFTKLSRIQHRTYVLANAYPPPPRQRVAGSNLLNGVDSYRCDALRSASSLPCSCRMTIRWPTTRTSGTPSDGGDEGTAS